MSNINYRNNEEHIKSILDLVWNASKVKRKLDLLIDYTEINSRIINMVNKAAIQEIPIKLIGLESEHLDLFPIQNYKVPIIPLFQIKPEALAQLLASCQDEKHYSIALKEQLRFL